MIRELLCWIGIHQYAERVRCVTRVGRRINEVVCIHCGELAAPAQ